MNAPVFQHLPVCAAIVAACLASPASSAPRWNAREFGSVVDLAPIGSDSVAVSWAEVPLHEATRRLSVACSATIHVDRRLDPSRPVTLRATGDAESLLNALAQANGWGVSSLAATLYLGPAQAAAELRTLHARSMHQAAELPAAVKSRLASRRAVEWQRLAQPREVLDKLLAEAKLRLATSTELPHDLWRAGSLARAPISEQLTLLLIGFDLEWRVSGGRVELSSITRPVVVEATHRPQKGARIDRRDFLSGAGSATLAMRDGAWRLKGRAEDHARLAALLRGDSGDPRASANTARQESPIADKRFTLRVSDQPAGAVLRSLAGSLGLSLAINVPRAELEKRVRIDVKEASLEELLNVIGRQASLQIKHDGRRLIVSPTAP